MGDVHEIFKGFAIDQEPVTLGLPGINVGLFRTETREDHFGFFSYFFYNTLGYEVLGKVPHVELFLFLEFWVQFWKDMEGGFTLSFQGMGQPCSKLWRMAELACNVSRQYGMHWDSLFGVYEPGRMSAGIRGEKSPSCAAVCGGD